MKTTLSQKKQDLLYSTVHEKCMKARVDVILFLKNNNLPYEEIDLILYNLCASAPKVALRVFESNPTTIPKTQPTTQETE